MTKKSTANNIKDTVSVFASAFLFFAVVGAVAGYNARQEVVIEKLLQSVSVMKRDGDYFFEYECPESNLVYIYSVDDNTGNYIGDRTSMLSLQKTALAIPTERFVEYSALISGVLGGATGGLRLSTVLKKPPEGWVKAQVQKTIIGIIGSISGYSVGYWLGSDYNTDCSSKLSALTLKDPDVQLRIERARLLISILVLENIEGAILSLTGNAIYAWDEDPAFICSPRLKSENIKLTALLATEIKDATSEHYQLIDGIAHLHSIISQTPEYRILLERQLFKHATQLTPYKDSDGVFGKHLNKKDKEWGRACEVVATISL